MVNLSGCFAARQGTTPLDLARRPAAIRTFALAAINPADSSAAARTTPEVVAHVLWCGFRSAGGGYHAA